MGKTSALAWIILTIALTGVAMAQLADKPAKPVLRDDAYYFSIGQMYDLHAYQHARMLLKFSQAGESVPADILKEHVSAIRANIAAAEKSFARLGDMTKKDPAAAKKLAEIKQYNVKILKLCMTLEASNEDQINSEVVAAHTRGIKEHLTAAFGASQDAADSANIFTEQWDQPGHGAFSD